MHTPTLGRSADVPATGVVTVSLDDFGKSRRGIGRATLPTARAVLNKSDDEQTGPPILLPPIETVQPKISKEIVAETPPIIAQQRTVRVGAAERKNDQPLDQELKRMRILGDRTPIIVQPPVVSPEVKTTPAEPTETRRTGAVNRPAVRQKVDTPEAQTPGINPMPQTEDKPRYQAPRRETPKVETPKEQPSYEPPRREETQKYERPQRVETPTRREEPRSEPPPQKREEPKSEPKRSDPPPAQKTSPSVSQPVRKKDGSR